MRSQTTRKRLAWVVLMVALAASWAVAQLSALPLDGRAVTAAPSTGDTADAIADYLLQVEPFTSDSAIVSARQRSAGSLEATNSSLFILQPPAELAEAHAFLVEGYQYLAGGSALLASDPDSILRSEAYFMLDWGTRQLWEHRDAVAQVLRDLDNTGPEA